MMTERSGLIVWLSDVKPAKNLEKYGLMHYVSKKMKYAVIYVNADSMEHTTKNLLRLPYVKKIERSLRNEIKTEYTRNVPDKTRFYSL